MRILSYSPSVEAYVKVADDVYDLSDDIVSCSVNRICDGASTFSITLQNHNFKYNNVFGCFDRIVVYATKDSRHKLFTGYITDTDRFSLYQSDFKISGKCTMYRLQKMYWDPGLESSQRIMWADAYNNGSFDNGFAKVASNLLMYVGGVDGSMIAIQGSIPMAAIEFAKNVYESRLDMSEQAKSMADEFYQILRDHGPKLVSGGSGYSETPAGSKEYTGIDFELSEKDFVAKWGPRIDAYLGAHYPYALSGHGNTIAREGRRNGCDPRIIVAIAVAESSAGKVASKSGIHGTHNYWSWGCYPGSESVAPEVGIWADSVDGAIAEFCQKFSGRYAGCSPAECAALGYGEADYIMSVWQPIIDAI